MTTANERDGSAPRTKAAVVEAFRRDAIVTAAIRVIARRGVEGMRVQDVAAEAGVAKGTVYLYFPTLAQVRAAAEARTAAELLDEVTCAARPECNIEQLVTAVVTRALERLDQRDDALLAALAFSRDPRTPALFPSCDCEIAHFILDTVRGVLDRRLHEATPRRREDVVSSTVSMLLHGIAAVHAASQNTPPDRPIGHCVRQASALKPIAR